MIHARTWGPGDIYAPEEKTLQLTITGDSLRQFQQILFRALNTAPPEQFPSWIALSDKLDELVRSLP